MMQTFTRIFWVILFLGVLWVDFDMENGPVYPPQERVTGIQPLSQVRDRDS